MLNLSFEPSTDDLYKFLLESDVSDCDLSTKRWLKQSPKNLLKAELYVAERMARIGGKRKTYDTHSIEVYLDENIDRLAESIFYGTYKPLRGTVHIINNPVQREICAAPYPDRIVHHYVVDTINPWWDRRLNVGASSCRVGKGTSYAVGLLDKHIRRASGNFARNVYVIKMDITGYFMHIKRELLLKRVLWGLDRQFEGNYNKRYQMVKYAIEQIIMDDPIDGIKIQGRYDDWRGLPVDKSLFMAAFNCGIVIGNVTSQVFSNIYLDALDRFMTIELGYKNYGRYVDDFYIVVTEEQLPQIKRDVEVIDAFLRTLGLSLNRKKTRRYEAWQGVPFLGTVNKCGTIMPDKRIYRNYAKAVRSYIAGAKNEESVASYLGMMKNYDAWRAMQKPFGKNKKLMNNFRNVIGDKLGGGVVEFLV